MVSKPGKRKREQLLNAFGQYKDEAFDFEYIERYFRKKKSPHAFQVLSDKTCNDLDFQELFMFVDRTHSKPGQQYLYNKLRTISLNQDRISLQEGIIEYLSTHTEERLSIQHLLGSLNDKDAYYIPTLFQEEQLQPPKWFFLVKLLSFTSLLSLLLLFFNPVMAFVLFGVYLINIGVHYWNKKNIRPYLSSIPQLLRLNNVARELIKDSQLRQINPDLLQSISIIDKVRNRMAFFKLEAKLQGDMEAIVWGILEFFKIMFLLEPLLLFGVLKEFDTKRKEIEEVFCFVGEIDAIISIASLRKGLTQYCIPTIHHQQKTMVMEEAYHPLIPDYVTNSIHVDQKSVLLTGSNMSGKTSFIRTVGINAIMGQTINTCFAVSLGMPPIRVFSAIRITDDLMNDKSYYFEEVLTIKHIIEKSIEPVANLFLLDEIFKGTNTVERISAGKAVLSWLSQSDNLVFVSTHDIELAELLDQEYELYHFSEKVNEKTVDFDYKLKTGKLKNRNAIRILAINDYPQPIIEEAIEIARKMDKAVLSKAL